MSIAMLEHKEHVNIIKQALEQEKKEDVNIRFYCEDGQFVTKSTHFKVFSKYFFKMFSDLDQHGFQHGCEYSVYLPSVSKDIITHITNIVSNGCTYFHSQKVLLFKILIECQKMSFLVSKYRLNIWLYHWNLQHSWFSWNWSGEKLWSGNYQKWW